MGLQCFVRWGFLQDFSPIGQQQPPGSTGHRPCLGTCGTWPWICKWPWFRAQQKTQQELAGWWMAKPWEKNGSDFKQQPTIHNRKPPKNYCEMVESSDMITKNIPHSKIILNYRFGESQKSWPLRLAALTRGLQRWGGGVEETNLGWGRWGRFSTTFLCRPIWFFLGGYRVPLHYWAGESSKKMIPSKEWGWCDWRKYLLACNYRKHVLNWTKSSHPIFRRSDFSMLGFGRGVSMPAQRFTASSHWFQHDFGWAQERFCSLEMFMGSLKNTTQMFGKQIIIIETHGNFQVTWGCK